MVREHTTYEPVGGMVRTNGWRAIYAHRNDDGTYCAHTGLIIAFALTRVVVLDAVVMRIVGYTPCGKLILPVEGMLNFIGYLGPGESVSRVLEEEARQYIENRGRT